MARMQTVSVSGVFSIDIDFCNFASLTLGIAKLMKCPINGDIVQDFFFFSISQISLL